MKAIPCRSLSERLNRIQSGEEDAGANALVVKGVLTPEVFLCGQVLSKLCEDNGRGKPVRNLPSMLLPMIA